MGGCVHGLSAEGCSARSGLDRAVEGVSPQQPPRSRSGSPCSKPGCPPATRAAWHLGAGATWCLSRGSAPAVGWFGGLSRAVPGCGAEELALFPRAAFPPRALPRTLGACRAVVAGCPSAPAPDSVAPWGWGSGFNRNCLGRRSVHSTLPPCLAGTAGGCALHSVFEKLAPRLGEEEEDG